MKEIAFIIIFVAILFSNGCISDNINTPTSVTTQTDKVDTNTSSKDVKKPKVKEQEYVTTVYMDKQIGIAFGTMDIPKGWTPEAETTWKAEGPVVGYQFSAFSPEKKDGVIITSAIPMGSNKIVPRQIISKIIGSFEQNGFTASIIDDRDMAESELSEFQKDNIISANLYSKCNIKTLDQGSCSGVETYVSLKKDNDENFLFIRIPVVKGPTVYMPEIKLPNCSYGGNTSYYTSYMFYIYGNKGKDELKNELNRFRSSIKLNKAWDQVAQNFIAEITNRNIEHSNRITEEFISLSDQKHNDMMELNKSISDSNDRINHMRSQQLREVKTVVSPFTGRSIEVDAFPDYTYETSDGEIIQSNIKLHE